MHSGKNCYQAFYLIQHVNPVIEPTTPCGADCISIAPVILMPYIFRYPLRRERDSNSRWILPHGGLANLWFKPLTHLSKKQDTVIKQIYANFYNR